MEYVISEDFILVTRNAQDFRGAGKTNPGGLHGVAEVHAGLICLDSALELDLDLQQELFKHALNTLAELPDLINQALEVYENEDGLISVNMYDIPPSRSSFLSAECRASNIAQGFKYFDYRAKWSGHDCVRKGDVLHCSGIGGTSSALTIPLARIICTQVGIGKSTIEKV